jgi:hypothetical protein
VKEDELLLQATQLLAHTAADPEGRRWSGRSQRGRGGKKAPHAGAHAPRGPHMCCQTRRRKCYRDGCFNCSEKH